MGYACVGLTNDNKVHAWGPFATRAQAESSKQRAKMGSNYRKLALVKAHNVLEAEHSAKRAWLARRNPVSKRTRRWLDGGMIDERSGPGWRATASYQRDSRVAEWWHIVASPAAVSRRLRAAGLPAKYSVMNYDRLPRAAKAVARAMYREWTRRR